MQETIAEWVARGGRIKRIEPLRLSFDDFLRIIDTIPQKKIPASARRLDDYDVLVAAK